MSDERKELTSNLTLFYQSYRRQHFYDSEELKKAEETYDKLRQIIQQKPEIDEKYVSKKIMETIRSLSHLNNVMSSVVYQEIKKKLDKLIRQIISDVKGRKT